MVRCSNCHKPLFRPESVFRGMGPICYGRWYTWKRLIKEGMNREQILDIPKEDMFEMSKEVVKQYYAKKKSTKKRKQRVSAKVQNYKKDRYQQTLTNFLVVRESNGHELKELKEEFNKLLVGLPMSNGFGKSDRMLELIEQIKRLEGK